MTTELTHRERVRLALAHRATDRVPMSEVCAGLTAPARAALEAWLREHRGMGVAEYLRPLIDVQVVGPAYVGPRLGAGEDIWGVHRSEMGYGSGAYMEIDRYPLAGMETVGDLERHRWPKPEWFDYSTLPGRIAAVQKEGPFALIVMNGNIFESSWYMRGMEQLLLDFAADAQMAHAILERVTDFYVEYFRRMLAAGRGEIDLAFTADDIGTQEGPMMSPGMWREFLLPYHQRLNAVIHEFGAKVVYHSDGAIMDAVPGLIEMGIDVLEALQFDAKGMDAARLKELYGDRLCFEGGISVQKTLPFGTVEEVKAEVRARIRVLGKGGGYILSPSHAIQAGTPAENMVAMFDTAAGA